MLSEVAATRVKEQPGFPTSLNQGERQRGNASRGVVEIDLTKSLRLVTVRRLVSPT